MAAAAPAASPRMDKHLARLLCAPASCGSATMAARKAASAPGMSPPVASVVIDFQRGGVVRCEIPLDGSAAAAASSKL